MASGQSTHEDRNAHDSQPRCRSASSRPVQTILNTGDRVHVFSRTAGEWVDAEVAQLSVGPYARVEYELSSHWCRKTLHMQSDHLAVPRTQPQQPRCITTEQSDTSSASEYEECDPGAYVTPIEAKSDLGKFTITLDDGLRVCGSLPDILNIEDNVEYEKHNAFSCSLRGCPLQGSIHIEHAFTEMVDVVLKVYARPAETRDNKYSYQEVEPYFVHTLVHKQGEKVKFTPICRSYFLGITLHKDLSFELQDKMRTNAGDKEYIQGLIDRFKKGWNEKGEAAGETRAEEADYLISYTGKNKRENDEMLRLLSSGNVRGPHGFRPIRFCTDRSLGFGVHFHDFKHGESIGDLTALNLGKHGFAQPIGSTGWWGEYEQAATRTKLGILVLNASPEYFSSAACKKEWKHIPEDLRCVWLQEERLIKRWQEIKHDEACTRHLLSTQPLHDAVKNDYPLELKRLLEERADANSETVNGKTPLMAAAGYGNLAAVKLLLDSRASVNAKCSSRGSTALMRAAAYGYHEKAPMIVELLVKRRADIQAKDEDDRTALEYCIYGKDGQKKQKMFGARKKIHTFLARSR